MNMAATNAIEIHGAGLVEEAHKARRDFPDSRPVALVAEGATSEAASKRGSQVSLSGPIAAPPLSLPVSPPRSSSFK